MFNFFINIIANPPKLSDPIGMFIKWMATTFGSVWLAVILFTLFLKLITLPLDYLSRASTKKGSLKMARIQPQLEKLKEQYAHDKNLYNQHMMALYKKEGYNVFGACLPMIVTLVIFIWMFASFRTFSEYQSANNYYKMEQIYNTEYITVYEPIYNPVYEPAYNEVYSVEYGKAHSEPRDAEYEAIYLTEKGKAINEGDIENAETRAEAAVDNAVHNKAHSSAHKAAYAAADPVANPAAQLAVKNSFKDINDNFFWVGNLWISDNPFEKMVPNYKKYLDISKVKGDNVPDPALYDRVVGELDKGRVNGYFILPLIAVAITVLSTYITTKTQAAQQNAMAGNAANTSKVMMFIMPIMIGIFAYTSSSAFALYMIFNSVLSVLTTIAVNKIVEKKFKEEEKKNEVSYKRKPIK